MKFKQFFSEKSIITELTRKTADKLPKNLTDLLTNKKLPFEKIFGDKLRIVEFFSPKSEYGEQIKNLLGTDFLIDFEKWTGYKLKDSEKKNPIRIGKLLQKKKQEILKDLKEIESFNSPGTIPTTEFSNVTPIKVMREELYKNQLHQIEELLKISDLQKTHNSVSKSQYAVIYSRVPIDVARMSDFSWKSCHSEDGDYFNCALADAMLNAGIAYLVDSENLILAATNGKENVDEFLQKEEIFEDSDRDVQGLQPLARIRIRNVMDADDNQLAVPSLKVYKSNKVMGIEQEFVQVVENWVKKQDSSEFNWSDTLILKGGSYQDLMYDVKSSVLKIWGKHIQYEVSADEEYQEDQHHEEEQFWDTVRNNIDVLSIYKDALGDEYHELFDVDLDLYTGRLYVEYNISEEFFKFVKKQYPSSINDYAQGAYKVNNQQFRYDINYRINGRRDVRLEFEKDFILQSFDYDVEASHFDYVEFKETATAHITAAVESFLGKLLPSSNLELRYYMNKKIADYYELSYQDSSTEELEYLDSLKESSNFYTGMLPSFVYNFKSVNNSNAGLVFVVSDQVRKYFRETFENFTKSIKNMANEKFSNLFDKLDVDLFECVVRVPPIESKGPRDGYSVRIGQSTDSNRKSIKLVVDSKLRKSVLEFILRLDFSDLEEIVDNGLIKEYYDFFVFLNDELSQELSDFSYVADLQDFLDSQKNTTNVKDENQMEFDFSSVNRIMNNFDRYVYKIWHEDLANMGKGALATRSSAGNQKSSSSSGFGMNSSSSGKTASTSGNSKKGVNITVSDGDLDGVLLNKDTDFDQILQNSDNHQPLFSYISNSLVDPQYKNKQQLQTLLQNNKSLAGAYNNFINKGAVS